MMNAYMDVVGAKKQVELKEKKQKPKKPQPLNQVLELQHTSKMLPARVVAVKEESLKLKSENQVHGQYIENFISLSSVFQTTDTKNKEKLGIHLSVLWNCCQSSFKNLGSIPNVIVFLFVA
ncbi:short coiled-coil protein B-like [Zalophus californianus]|uniref:Short coiled-coil protein B-like n=1 Tax=Zalophus californianus TaxID=9704 RepID=A0A6P9FL05_ZALCA|nr:short coiled-coil protein B-like [Zalophus californianus]